MSESYTIPAQSATTQDFCNWGGRYCPPAEIVAADGQWCSYECQGYDRVSEITAWRRAVAA